MTVHYREIFVDNLPAYAKPRPKGKGKIVKYAWATVHERTHVLTINIRTTVHDDAGKVLDTKLEFKNQEITNRRKQYTRANLLLKAIERGFRSDGYEIQAKEHPDA